MEKSLRALSEQDWASYLEQFANFKGSMAEFCRLNDINYESLRVRNKEKLKSVSSDLKSVASNFVKVEPKRELAATPEARKSYPHLLPEPEWLAEFIHKLMETRR